VLALDLSGDEALCLPGTGQRRQYRLGRGVALGRVLGQQPDHHALHFLGDAQVFRPRRCGRRVESLGEDGQRVVAGKGGPAREQLVQHRPHGVQVGAVIHRPVGDHLRRQVQHRADDHALLGQAHVPSFQRQPKVGHLDVSIGCDHDILGLDVAMDDALGVGVGQRPQRAADGAQRAAHRQWAAALHHHRAQVPARDVLQHQVVPGVFSAHVVECHDVGV
jgi:hypothetical protein